MPDKDKIVLAAKCSPERKFFDQVAESGIGAVELYTNDNWIDRLGEAEELCASYPFRYAVHAPTEGYRPRELAEFVRRVKAESLVLHDIYWQDEWSELVEIFKDIPCRLCVENTDGVIAPMKVIRRFGLMRCLDLEHAIQQVLGVFDEPFGNIIRSAGHIHMTGYTFCNENWHTNLHHAPEQSRKFLDMLFEAEYSGFVVSEASVPFQTVEEWGGLKNFFDEWRKG